MQIQTDKTRNFLIPANSNQILNYPRTLVSKSRKSENFVGPDLNEIRNVYEMIKNK